MNISWLISVVLVRLVEVLVVGVDPGAALDVLPVPLQVLVLLGAELVDLKMVISLVRGCVIPVSRAPLKGGFQIVWALLPLNIG